MNSSRSTAQVLFKPGKHGFVPAFAVQCAENPVAFVGKTEGFRRNTGSPQRGEELQTLVDRDAEILLVRDDQRRRPDLVRGEMRRAALEMFARGGAPRRAAGF